jgi:hypothetical protein
VCGSRTLPARLQLAQQMAAEQPPADRTADDGSAGVAPPPIVRAPADILAATLGTASDVVVDSPEPQPHLEPEPEPEPELAGLGDMMRGGLSAFRARSKQLGATLEASVAQLSAPPAPSAAAGASDQAEEPPLGDVALAEAEPAVENGAEAGADLDTVPGVSPPPGPTAFGLRKVGNRSDPWCLGAISEESYGAASATEEEEQQQEEEGDEEEEEEALSSEREDESSGGGVVVAADLDAVAAAAGDEVVDARCWRGVIWADSSRQNLARLSTAAGRAALLRCLRAAATAQPDATPLQPEVWWRLGDLLGVGLSAAVESGEIELAVDLLVRSQRAPLSLSRALPHIAATSWVRAAATSDVPVDNRTALPPPPPPPPPKYLCQIFAQGRHHARALPSSPVSLPARPSDQVANRGICVRACVRACVDVWWARAARVWCVLP